MNYLQKIKANKDIRSLFRQNYPEGCIKVTSEALNHFTVKCQVAHWFKKQGFDIYCEPSFKNGSRPDLLVCNQQGDAYIVEILSSETEKRFQEKIKSYPELTIVKVYAKDFDYDNFKY
jgi:hypothetical protein